MQLVRLGLHHIFAMLIQYSAHAQKKLLMGVWWGNSQLNTCDHMRLALLYSFQAEQPNYGCCSFYVRNYVHVVDVYRVNPRNDLIFYNYVIIYFNYYGRYYYYDLFLFTRLAKRASHKWASIIFITYIMCITIIHRGWCVSTPGGYFRTLTVEWEGYTNIYQIPPLPTDEQGIPQVCSAAKSFTHWYTMLYLK